MIDGIKIDCNYLVPETWRYNPALEFIVPVSDRTGEVVAGTISAEHNGLKFKIVPSANNPGIVYCQITGSLHRFHNEGGHNGNDFPYTALKAVIDHLGEAFAVDPARSWLRGLEFGVNIDLPITARAFLNGIICLPDKEFTPLNIERVKVGVICQRTEYGLKIYDKGLQTGEPVNNLLRVEVKVNKMRYLHRRVDIRTLADLADRDKLASLGDLLAELFGMVVFYDGSIDPARLSSKESLCLEQFTNAHRWRCMGYQARHKFAQRMAEFMTQHGANAVKENALLALKNKWILLLFENGPQKKGDDFTAIFGEVTADKKVMISPLECRVKSSPYCDKKTTKKEKRGKGGNSSDYDEFRERTLCIVCKRDISGQKKGSRFCSSRLFGKGARRCRDHHHGRQRTARRQAARQMEREALEVLLQTFPPAAVRLSIYWRAESGSQYLTIRQDRVPPLDPRTMRRVYLVEAEADGQVHRFTGSRARHFLTTTNRKK